jgi:hypothetical protein
MNTSEHLTPSATADVRSRLEAPLASGAELTDADLEAVAGGKDMASAFAGGLGAYAGAFSGGQRRGGYWR